MNKFALGLLAVMMLGGVGTAQAACAPGTADFDSCFNAQLGQMQQQNANSMQQTWNAYLQAYGPQLQQAYQQWGYQTGASFDQFAYYMLMTANGTNIQGGLDAQRRAYEGIRDANTTVKQGYDDYNAGSVANSNITMGAIEGYDRGAARGNVMVDGPNGPVELPYSGMQVGQAVQSNGYTYMMTQQGYAVWNGYGWQLAQ